MAIKISVQCNGGFLPDILLLTASGFPIKCHEKFLSLQPSVCSHLNVLTNSPPPIGCIFRSTRCVQSFLL